MQSSNDATRYVNSISFPQELSKVMNQDCFADRCDDQISFA